MSVYHTTYTFHLHTPVSYLLSRFSPVTAVNVLHYMSRHTTIITLHVCVTMGYHCICLYTIPPTHSTFTLPLQILTCGHGQRTTSHITPHHCYHYTFVLQWGIIVYVCIPYHLHIPPSHSLSRFSPVAMVNVLHHISHHTTVITTRLCYNGVSLYMSVYHTTYTFHLHTPSPGSHLWPWSTYYITYHTTLLLSLHVCVTMGYHCICLYTIPPTHSTFTLPLQVLTCGHGQRTTSHITPHNCYHTTRLGYNEVSLYMSVYHTTYTFHLHTPSPGSHLWPWSTYYITYHTTPLLSLHVCVTMGYHCICLYTIPPTHSTFTLPLQVLTCGHGQRTTSHITPHHCYHYTFVLQWGIIVYVCIPYHLHIPPSHSLSRFSPVVTVNVLHHISHYTTVITLHVWVAMMYHCICLYTIPPTHSTFTLPPLISSPGSHLWSRSTYYITYHTTSLLSLHVWVTMGYHCICLYTMPPTHSTFTLPYLISSLGSHLWPRSTYITYHTTPLLSQDTYGL